MIKDILDIVIPLGMAYILFIVLRGFNENQVKKNEERLKQQENLTNTKKEEK